MEHLHVIVGLGNPGPKYVRTRHNIGFQLVERLAGNWQLDWEQRPKFSASVAGPRRAGAKAILARPDTFMNSSGEAVAALVDFYQVPVSRLLVAVDDADLPLGAIRLRGRGSSGGHHGLESVEKSLGTQSFARLRMGIGRVSDGAREIADYVLAPFSRAEAAVVDGVLAAASGQVECWLDEGLEIAMNRFNGAVSAPDNKGKTE